jgi:SAM-dependent methyltransferase
MTPTGTSPFYDALAPIYDEWQAASGALEFSVIAARKLCGVLEQEERRLRGDDRHAPAFLDLGCGTGSLLLDVRDARPRWRLAGADGSAGMLRVARAKPGAGRVVWARATIDQPLPFAPAFDACGAFHDTINHLPDEPALARAFAAAAALLRPGGLLVFDVTNLVGFRLWWNDLQRYAGRRWTITVTTTFDDASRTGAAEVAIARQDGGVGGFHVRERYFDDGQIAGALVAAGLSVEQHAPWAPFGEAAAGKTWWLARRPAA